MSVRVAFESRLLELLPQQRAAARAAMQDIGNVWLGESTLLTPVDSGMLRASLAWAADGERQHSKPYPGSEASSIPPGVVEYHPSAPERTLRLGSNTEYAIFVHENLFAHHKVGRAKFISAPLRQNAEKWVEYIARKAGEATG